MLPKKPVITCLPGYTLSDYQGHNPLRENAPRSHIFDKTLGYSQVRENIEDDEPDWNYVGNNASLQFRSTTATFGQEVVQSAFGDYAAVIPAHIAYDKQVLRFYGYFKEGVTESALENYRIRRVEIHFHVEDDSIAIKELKQDNSGMPQGSLIRRHRIPIADGTRYYGMTDFALNGCVGNEIGIYGKVFRLTDADNYTRQYLEQVLGAPVSEKEVIPADPYTEKRLQGQVRRRDDVSKTAMDKLKQFLDFDRKVLRFYCKWNDREALFGEIRHFIFHFFLADDTAEIIELYPPNCGRDSFPQFLKRGPLVKEYIAGVDSGRGERFSPADFKLGSTLDVLGKSFYFYDADPFTREYYGRQFPNYDMTPIDVTEEPAPNPRMELPPHTGFGSEEDSLSSCLHIVPKARKANFQQFLDNEGKILRFGAQFVTNRTEDLPRRFIIAYYLEDDTIAIFENPRRNSGFVAGKFLERQKVTTGRAGSYFYSDRLFVGANVELNKFIFKIYTADEYTIRYMEERADKYEVANSKIVFDKIRAGADVIKAKLSAKPNSKLSLQDLRALLTEANVKLVDHELLTVLRQISGKTNGEVECAKLLETI